MSQFLLNVGKILFPGTPDQQIMQAIQEIKQEDPSATDEDIVLEVLEEFMATQGSAPTAPTEPPVGPGPEGVI